MSEIILFHYNFLDHPYQLMVILMHITTNQLVKPLYWSPRVLGMVIVALFTLLSLDVFGEYQGVELLIALVMHLIPALLLLATLIISWKNELYGAMIYNILAVFSIFFFETYGDIIVFFIITLPLLLIGELFFLDWYWRSSDFRTKPEDN